MRSPPSACGGLSEKLLAIAGAGFKNVELSENDFLAFNGTPREVGRMIDDRGLDFLSWGRHYRNFPGQGDLPLDAFMQALLATGYDGLLSLEIFNDQFRAGSARSVAVDGHRSLIAMLDQVQAGQPNAHRVAPVLPRKPKCLGTEFGEVAIDEESAVGFERLLSGLGFGKTGEHVSKSVTRWNQ